MKFLVPVIALLCCSILLSGCVSEGVHRQKLEENAHLQEVIRSLKADYEALLNDKKQVIARNDDLNNQLLENLQRSSLLQQDLDRARSDLARVEKVLEDRSAEAGAALAEMRQTIDQLTADNQQLAQQLEEERLAREARLAEIQGTYDELVNKLESEIQRGEVTISELQGKLTVNVVDQILFDSGKAELKSAGVQVLQRIGDVLKSATGKEIQVEGHTDNVPISPRLQAKFPSNWELSTARATTVLHFLQDKVRISGERLSAVGFGEYRPIASNSDAAGRKQNRRIQIILVDQK
jgi:chemotaxis protein MotB